MLSVVSMQGQADESLNCLIKLLIQYSQGFLTASGFSLIFQCKNGKNFNDARLNKNICSKCGQQIIFLDCFVQTEGFQPHRYTFINDDFCQFHSDRILGNLIKQNFMKRTSRHLFQDFVFQDGGKCTFRTFMKNVAISSLGLSPWIFICQ